MKKQTKYRLEKLTKNLYLDMCKSCILDPHRFSYGPFSFLAALSNLGIDDPKITRAARKSASQLKFDSQFPWEFIHWSIFESELNHQDFNLSDKLLFKGTTVLNWRLLKIYSQLRTSNILLRFYYFIFLKLLLLVFTKKDGFLSDRIGTKSFQYHAFSCFILCRIRISYKLKFLDHYIFQGVLFLKKNKIGRDLYLWRGRGQEQIFGYAALLYLGYYTRRSDNCALFNDVLDKFLKVYEQRDNLPLVLSNIDEEKDCDAVGWYGYNNLYDYKAVLLLVLSIILKAN